MARTGINFAESCVRAMARATGEELAARVHVAMDPAMNRYTVKCGELRAHLDPDPDPAQFARALQKAVETVMGLREPEGTVR